MTRPKTISDEEILTAAREVFLDKGPSVPTAQIARRAGISEGTIFRRFSTKQVLFLAALGIKGKEDWSHGIEDRVGEGTVQDNLISVTMTMIDFLRDLVPRVMVMHARSGKSTATFFHGEDSPVRRNFVKLIEYLEGEMRLGRLRRSDPETIARILGASGWNFAFHEAIDSHVFTPVEAETFAAELVGTLWTGLAPAGNEGRGEGG